MKAVSLIVLIIFATIASFVVLGSSSQTVEENVDFTKTYGSTQLNDKVIVEPLGDPIDTPGAPGQLASGNKA